MDNNPLQALHHYRTFILTALAALVAASMKVAPACHAQIVPDKVTFAPERSFEVRPIYKNDTVTVVVLGDIMMHQKQIEAAMKESGEYDFSSYFSLIHNKIAEADIAIGNMEFTLAGEPYSGYPCFSAPDSFAQYNAECGFDIFLCANNHILDKGKMGAERTLRIYRDYGLKYGTKFTGLAASSDELEGTTPLFVISKGIRIAILNFTYGTNNPGSADPFPAVNRLNDTELMKSSFQKAEKADFVLVLPHWGNEYELTHSPAQRKMAQWMVDNGADMIIGSHPHVVQDVQTIDGVKVVYSLGNAVSNMSAVNTQLELMATVRIIRKGNGDIEVPEPELTWLWCSRPGGYNNGYTVVPVEGFIGRKHLWKGAWDYERMVETYNRIKR